ncbi:MAG TPA: rod shape-determining protein MreD [Erysipelotrichaceae bacterium]|nr:rod shape-determining protein MreD [Erysipelotrichaceae bacterium]
MSKFIYLILCFTADLILSQVFPLDYALYRLNFIPHVGLIGLMLVARELDLGTALIMAFGFGLFLDFTHYGYFMMNAFVFTLTIWILRQWSNQVNESIVELLVLGVLTIFVKEFLIFSILHLFNASQMRFLVWFAHWQFLSLLGNLPLMALAIYGYHLVEGFLSNKDRRRRQGEKTLWMKMLNPYE